MQNLTQIAEEVLLLNPGDAVAKKIAAMLDAFSQQEGIADSVRKSAQDACKLAKKLATKKSTAEDLQEVRSTLLPVRRLHSAFDIADAGTSISGCILVVAEAKSKRVAILADGHISLILDVEGAMRVCLDSSSGAFILTTSEVAA